MDGVRQSQAVGCDSGWALRRRNSEFCLDGKCWQNTAHLSLNFVTEWSVESWGALVNHKTNQRAR